jgi:tetratricopeptide (TPR) repeat protein
VKSATGRQLTLLFMAALLLLPAGNTGAQTPETASGSPDGGVSTTTKQPPASDTDQPFDASITVPELFEKAREAFGLEKLGLAEKFYQEILIRDRSNLQAMLELSNVYERSGNLEYARGLLARSAKLSPGDRSIAQRLQSVERMLASVLTEEVDSLMAAAQYELAIPKLSLHISFEPENPETYYKRAVCYSRLGKPNAALVSINSALKLDQAEQYLRLQTAIFEDMKSSETKELVAEAKKLIQGGDPDGHRKALELLGEVLQAAPGHTWARTEFVRLSKLVEESEAGTVGGEGEESGAASAWKVIRNSGVFVAGMGRTAAGLARAHLSALLLLITVLVIFRSPFTQIIAKAFKPRYLLSGRFPRFPLSEILIMLNTESHSGLLRVKGVSCRGKIYVDKGEPCHCAVGKLDGVYALYHLLGNTGDGYFEFAEESIPLKRSIDTPLSVILMEYSDGGPGSASKRRSQKSKSKKPKSRMKELLENKSGK